MRIRLATMLLISTVCAFLSCAATSAMARCQVSITSYGAQGDGIADDTSAVQRSLGSDCSVSGEGLDYRITSTIRLPDGVHLFDATFLQDIPAHGLMRVFLKQGGKNVTIRNIRINRGSNPRLGTIEDAAAIWIANVAHVTLTDIEVFGDGLGTGILVANSSNVQLIRPHVHDMTWKSDRQPENEVMVGIWSLNSEDVTIESPKISDLKPVAIQATSGRAAGRRNNMTDGLASSGTKNLIIRNPDISNVGEGIDISGSHETRDFAIAGGNIRDVDSFCYKATNVQGPGVIRDSRAVRCGLGGYIMAGPVTQVELRNNLALDIGSNGHWAGHGTAGFALEFAYGAMPSEITIADCSAVDSQPSRTMRIGFRSDRIVPSNRLINATATGYVLAPAANF